MPKSSSGTAGCKVRFHQPLISVLVTYSYGKPVGSFKVLAPSDHGVVWIHSMGETKTINFLRTRPTASDVIKHLSPSRSCGQMGRGSPKILINSMVSTKTRLNSPSETSHSSLVSSLEHI